MQIVMQLMQGPNICAYVASSHQYYEAEARKVFRDITGAAQLYQCRTVHALHTCVCTSPCHKHSLRLGKSTTLL